MKQDKISVIGAGGWGTALSIMLARNEKPVTLCAWFEEERAELERDRENKKYLPGFTIPDTVKLTSDMEQAVAEGDIIAVVTPSKAVRNAARRLSELDLTGKTVVCMSKGIEMETLMLMTEVIEQELGEEWTGRVVGLSGPNLAREVAAEMPTGTIAACPTLGEASRVQKAFNAYNFRVFVAKDVVGVELAGALKNIVAIAVGVSDGLGYGDNTRASLLTRGLMEISRLGVEMGARELTFLGLAGCGDLICTGTSNLSRNHRAGQMLGEGCTVDEVIASTGMVIEGIYTTKAAYQLAKQYEVPMPIVEEMYEVLYNKKPMKQALSDLLSRPGRLEW